MEMNKVDSRIEVLLGDITKVNADAIVNAANNSLLGGGGVDGAIHRAAGPELLAECRTLGGCDTGDAKMTKGYRLPAKGVIPTGGPVWRGGGSREAELLASCYRKSLQAAVLNEIKSIAFPSISTGVYAFPLKRACVIAIKTIREFLEMDGSIEKIYLVCFGQEAYDIYSELLMSDQK